MISIIDYGVGNLGSIKNMLKFLDIESKVVTTAEELSTAKKIILPGVGSWDNALVKLKDSGLLSVLNERVLSEKVPVLGICLGMQILLDSSEEGVLAGLGWIPGKVKKFDFSEEEKTANKLRIPHMGWNVIHNKKQTALTSLTDDEIRYYFVHSFHAEVENKENILMTCNYGYEFTCAIQRGNIWGVQFHPEKSHKFGMSLMKSFAEL